MPSKKTRISRRKIKNNKHHHFLLILLLIAAVIVFLYKDFGKEDLKPVTHEQAAPAETAPPEKDDILPRVAIVIDDLGPNKKAVIEILDMDVPFTFSVLPNETYSRWIADRAHAMGHDVVGHIPMEAKTPHKLGNGGLYTWMTDNEILKTLIDDIDSIPHIKGISNHMGSAFTEDKRAMRSVISALKEHGLFYLDSLTTSRSAGFNIADEMGIQVFKRDIFLDIKDDPDFIRNQWASVLKIAGKKGFAITIAHPRQNTVEFFRKTLPQSRVRIVPLSELSSVDSHR